MQTLFKESVGLLAKDGFTVDIALKISKVTNVSFAVPRPCMIQFVRIKMAESTTAVCDVSRLAANKIGFVYLWCRSRVLLDMEASMGVGSKADDLTCNNNLCGWRQLLEIHGARNTRISTENRNGLVQTFISRTNISES